MTPKNKPTNQIDFLKNEWVNLINLEHPLCKMAKLIDWQKFETEFSKYYCATNGRPGASIRLMVSLEYLKQMSGLSDEEVVEKWL